MSHADAEPDDQPIEDNLVYLAEATADEYHEIPAAAVHHVEVPAAPSAVAARHVTDDHHTTAEGLKHLVTSAGRIKDSSNRELALLNALRTCRRELDAAKLYNDAATKRLQDVKAVYNYATRILSGYTPLEERSPKNKTPPQLLQQTRRTKIKRDSDEIPIKTEEELPLPTNPIHVPQQNYHLSPEISPEMISQHKQAFYQNLLNIPLEELPSHTPPSNNANLKSRHQLAEWIYIAQNWNTGADGLDAGAFRAKYKTWYSKMKPVTVNLGRRTGIHLREIEEEGATKTVLCRHSKDGSKSVMYLDIEMLFDALYEIHVVELDHRGRDATKNLADERYANVPDAQVRCFIDSCPVCLGKKGGMV
jgi:hypothetical protein